MLFYFANFLFTAAVSAIPIGRMDIVYPSIETARSGNKIIKFRALNQYIHLRLEPAGDTIADDFTMVNGANEKIEHSINIENIKRKLYKNKKMGTAVYVDEEGLVTINGIINSKLKIEPYQLEKEMNKDGGRAHRVIEILKPENSDTSDETVHADLKENLNDSIKHLTDDDCIRVEVVFILESEFTSSFNSDSELALYIFNTVNGVQFRFDSLELGIKIVLIGVIKLTKENETSEAPYIKKSLLSHYSEYLHFIRLPLNMAVYYCERNIPLIERADTVILISRREFGFEKKKKLQTYPIGYSYLGKICSRCWKFGIVEEAASKAYWGLDTIAHEIAHQLGSVHDGDSPESTIPNSPGAEDCPLSAKYIMGNLLYDPSAKFSKCSQKNIQNFLTLKRAHCVIEKCQANSNF